MSGLLFLAHRIPYPPDKGDKIRSYHVLKALAGRHRVYLGAFVDDAEDWKHADALRDLCAEVMLLPLANRRGRLRACSGLVTGRPLTLPYYANRQLSGWVGDLVHAGKVASALAYSGAMAQFLEGYPELHRVMDFVDVDSSKWTQYASTHRFPLSWLYRREGARLLAWERRIARTFDASFFVSRDEAAHFVRLAPDCGSRVSWYANGVDAAYFDPALPHTNPYPPDAEAIAFTGAMNYWPNADAVEWFAREVLPQVRARHPTARFFIVGGKPLPSVSALAELPGVTVTGRVDDVRPYLAHARVAVAPLHVARGVQNKVLEAMAMARPVVATPEALEGIAARDGVDVVSAVGVAAQCAGVVAALEGSLQAMARVARERVLANYDWSATLAPIVAAFEPARAAARPAVPPSIIGEIAA